MTGLPFWYHPGYHPTHTDSDPCFLKIQCYLQRFWYFFSRLMALYFSSTFEPLLEYVHQSNHLLLNLFNHWLIRQVEHWTEAITQFFDGLGAWGAKQLISIAGRDCAIEWRAVIQRVISMGKPMGKPLRPYSGIVWLKKLNIEMWDECEMIAVYLRISFHTWSTYCIVNSQHQHDINMFF